MKISIIGCGNMGAGVARRIAKDHQLSLLDRDQARLMELSKELNAHPCKNLEEAAADAEIIILAVKPQNLTDLTSLKLTDKQLLVSILAGVSTKTLKHHFSHVHILRMMPNLAVLYGQGVVGLVDSPDLSPDMKKKVETMCKDLGHVFWIDENKIDSLTSLTGSGPAFVFVMIESMIDAAIAMGFTAAQGRELVIQMLTGSLTMLNETKKHPADLKWHVASPAGTTIAGLKKMEEEGVRSGILNTFIAAHQRALQLSSEHTPKS